MTHEAMERALRPTAGSEVEITCTTEEHGRAVLARLVRLPRWDGAGYYWGKLTEMTDREARAWQEMEPGDGSQMPRAYREPRGDGFYWRRDGVRVTDPREARLISNAAHHGSGEHRRGEPVPGILDGVERRFELRACRCGRGGQIRAAAATVEAALELGHVSAASEYDVVGFRRAIGKIGRNA